MTGVPTRDELIAHLVRKKIAGEVATPRQSNLKHYHLLAQRDPYYLLGLSLTCTWSFDEVLALMAKRCGVSPDERHLRGQDTIDPELTADALDAMAERIGAAARPGVRVLLATGHPDGLLDVYRSLAVALARAGCAVLTPAEGWTYRDPSAYGPSRRTLVYREGVGVVTDGKRDRHSHAPEPMQAILATSPRDEWPDLVIADHGLAGAAGEAGVATVGFADCNDPALFVGEAEGKIAVSVPLDDNVMPGHYLPLTRYLLAQAGLRG
ncbi:MAG: phosphatase [Streptosporangiales bacterium]|nr:phosphatase [Streptosporangiales bacterium]